MATVKKKAKKRHPGKVGVNLLMPLADQKALKALAKHLTAERGSRVCQTDLLREGYRLVIEKYAKS